MPFNVTPADLAAALADQIDHLKPDWVTERLERICKLVRFNVAEPSMHLRIADDLGSTGHERCSGLDSEIVHVISNLVYSGP